MIEPIDRCIPRLSTLRHPCQSSSSLLFTLPKLLAHRIARGISCCRSAVAIKPRRRVTPPAQPQPAVLFRDAVRCLKAVRKLLAVLIACVIRQHLLARGALERLEARFALDGLRGGVLETLLVTSHTTRPNIGFARRVTTYGFQLALRLLGTRIALAITLLLCPALVNKIARAV